MLISGLQKMTLLDFPGKVACTVFTAGCNLRCPFCHNAALVTDIDKAAKYAPEEVLAFLQKRKGLLDGVCISGGEPLLQEDVENFIAGVKKIGFAVKLDTNGCFPDKLKDLVGKGLLDYVALDVKNTREKYTETVGAAVDLAAVEESIRFLLQGTVDYEFRTTVVAEFHTLSDIETIAARLRGAKRYFLQNFVDSGNLIGKDLHAVDEKTLREMQKAAAKHLPVVHIRGI